MSQTTNQTQYNDCIFCSQHQDEELLLMMNDALKAKHLETQQNKFTNYIDAILKLQSPANQQEAWACHQFREYLVDDEQQEFMKRQYAPTQFTGKITMLAEYYKFHSDVPRVIELGVERIMGRYYDKKRQNDYRKVKKVLKEEQGMSITSVQGSESFASAQAEKRSRYSTLLNALNHSKTKEQTIEESAMLMEVCGQLDKGTGKEEQSLQIGGSFHEDELFEQYLKHEEGKMRNKLKEKNKSRQEGHKVVSKLNLKQLLKKRENSGLQPNKPLPQHKPKQKQNKFVYNTNVKIEIRNAMFFSQGQRQTLEQQLLSKVDPRMRRRPDAGTAANAISQHDSHQKMLAMIYKPSLVDLKNKAKVPTSRTSSKEGNFSRDRQKSLGKLKNFEVRQKIGKSQSQNRLASINRSSWKRSEKTPIRSMSINNLKKRTSGQKIAFSAWNSKANHQKRPIETISRYGSSELKSNPRTHAIKQLLNRKLNLG